MSMSNFTPVKSVHMIAIAIRLRFQISLMVVFRRQILRSRKNMRLYHMVLELLYFPCDYFILDLLLYFFCDFHLLLIVAKNGRGVLRALIIHLPVCLRRVMEREEELYQFLEAYFAAV